ncbi:DUF2157 domain-containing protein [Chitinophaga lutea]|uniref:DUF2157 domain-containing protein n=1 Tax=Chitinophaga lutea TaxID=2488634 RepID=A0A3N4PMW4_9BACT|nr:DUF2157 domain-containing protein [Chitinophaga lutea]RPE07979.1 DUF2157 domain-containing protein [Chitinophaga lutea]
MNRQLFEKLAEEDRLSPSSMEKIRAVTASTLFSVHWELKTILYLGVLLLSGGLGILIYKNIDTIGHQAILALIAVLCAGCFYYSNRHKLPFSRQKVPAANAFADYTVLLGCLLFITFITYLQAQYNVFGTRYGSATFIPMLVLFFSAYYFDHLGVLSMAITNFAAWAGIAITPFEILSRNDFSSDRIIYTGLAIGVVLIVAGILSTAKDFKQHFSFAYHNFGTHILLIACLSAMFVLPDFMLWFIVLGACCAGIYYTAMQARSFYFVVIVVLYAYTGLSYVVIRGIDASFRDLGGFYMLLFYFIGSGIAMARLLIVLNKKLKKHDSI